MKLGTCRHCGAALLQGSLGCLDCGRLVDEHEAAERTGTLQTQLGTQVRDALIDGRWRLIQPLGRGRRTTAWLAHDVPFDRRVVVKLLDEAVAREPAQVARFEENARRLARVDHKNVVAVLSLGRHQGVPFVAMRQAEGRSLAEHLHAHGGRLSAPQAAVIVAQLAEAFEAVHGVGGPQAGLQPRAIFVADSPEVRVTLLDVGAGTEPGADVTHSTVRLTERLEWVAPEVLAGAPPSVQSDVFTLGCVAWELARGSPPPRPLPPLEDAGLQGVIARATHTDPAQRFGSARELLEALAPLAAVTPEPAVNGVAAPAPVEVTRRVEAPTAPMPAPTVPMSAMPTPFVPSPAVKRKASEPPARRRDLVAAGVIVLGILVLVLILSWERAPGPLPPISMAAIPGVASAEPARPAEPTFETTPESVLERRQGFEKLNTGDALVKKKGRTRALVRARPQVAEYLGKQAPSELQVMVLYGGHEVRIEVIVDKRWRGESPLFLPLSPGNHTVFIEQRPLEPVTVPVSVPAHKSVRLEIELMPVEEPGSVTPE